MTEARVGSAVVVDEAKVVGILTLSATSCAAWPAALRADEPVRLWMTPGPDVLGPDETVSDAWRSLTHHHYRHLPVVDDGTLLGVVSLRDVMGAAAGPAEGLEIDGSGRPGGRGGGRDGGRRCAGPGGLLPLPPVLGGGPGRPAQLRGRVAPPGRGHPCPTPTRPPAVRGRDGAAAAAAPGPRPPAARAGPGRGAPRRGLRTAVSLLGSELGWGSDPGRATRAPWPPRPSGWGPSCPPCWPPCTGCSREAARWPPGTIFPTPPTTCGCSGAPSPRSTRPGRSSST